MVVKEMLFYRQVQEELVVKEAEVVLGVMAVSVE